MLKCFLVDCDGDNGAQVYFATTRGQAKALAASEEGCGITEVVSCRRKPEWDVFAPGPVPIKVLLEEGWWFECSGCSQQVTDDGECYHGADYEPGDSEPIIERGQVWCCQGCKDADEIREAQRKIDDVKRRREAMAAFAVKFPEVKPCRIDVCGRQKAMIRFRIPGAGSEIIWSVGDTTVQVLPGDLRAWYAWEDSRREPIMTWEEEGGAIARECA